LDSLRRYQPDQVRRVLSQPDAHWRRRHPGHVRSRL